MRKSSITIDGMTITGTAANVMLLQYATQGALDRLAGDDAPEDIWIPFTGRDDDGHEVVQTVRLRRDSSVTSTIIEDGAPDGGFFETMRGTHHEFLKKYGPAPDSASHS